MLQKAQFFSSLSAFLHDAHAHNTHLSLDRGVSLNI